MLDVLRRHEETEGTGLLAAAARTLLPQPTTTKPSDEVIELLREARTALRISEEDASPRATTKLADYFSELLTERLLPKEERKPARERLGEKGLLAASQFNISLNPLMTVRGAVYRARWNHVVEAITHADFVEHFRAVDREAKAPLVDKI
jgi:hypothetical protein